MDLSAANTEASLRLHRTHEQLNISLKVQVIGLGLLADEIESGGDPMTLKARLYRRRGWLWGGMPDWTSPAKFVQEARRDIGLAGVVRTFSAFDLFMDEIAADLNRWRDFSGDGPAFQISDEVDDDADRAARFYHQIGATPSAVSFIWPLYRYFRFARDCAVHRDGLASPALEEAYSASDLGKTLKNWKKTIAERSVPEVPAIRAGKAIQLSHRQAIVASSIIRRIAFDINRQALKILGERGLVYLAARRGFLEKESILDPNGGYRTMLNALNRILSDRYRVRGVTEAETARILRSLELATRCAQRFAAMRRSV